MLNGRSRKSRKYKEKLLSYVTNWDEIKNDILRMVINLTENDTLMNQRLIINKKVTISKQCRIVLKK